MHPDFSAVVHLHPGGPVVDDDDPLIYIGDGIQAAGLCAAVRRASGIEFSCARAA